jgi:hypothetical protein
MVDVGSVDNQALSLSLVMRSALNAQNELTQKMLNIALADFRDVVDRDEE